jgi:hypothetical protein
VFVEEDEELIELQEENTNVQLAEEELLAIGIVFYSHFVLLKIECCLMPTQQFFRYIMARTSYFSMR